MSELPNYHCDDSTLLTVTAIHTSPGPAGSAVRRWRPSCAGGMRYPQAAHVAELALREFKAGHVQAPELALPVYLRDKVALTLVEQGRA